MAEGVLEAVRRLQESQQAEIASLRRLCAHFVRTGSQLRRDYACLSVQHQVLLDCLDHSGELRPKVRAQRHAQRESPLCALLQSDRCARAVVEGAGAAASRGLYAASRAYVEGLAAPLSEAAAAGVCGLPPEAVGAAAAPVNALCLDDGSAHAAVGLSSPEAAVALAEEPIGFMDVLQETWPYCQPANMLFASLETPVLQGFCAVSRAARASTVQEKQKRTAGTRVPEERGKEAVPTVAMRIQEGERLIAPEPQPRPENGERGEGPSEPAVPPAAAEEAAAEGSGIERKGGSEAEEVQAPPEHGERRRCPEEPIGLLPAAGGEVAPGEPQAGTKAAESEPWQQLLEPGASAECRETEEAQEEARPVQALLALAGPQLAPETGPEEPRREECEEVHREIAEETGPEEPQREECEEVHRETAEAAEESGGQKPEGEVRGEEEVCQELAKAVEEAVAEDSGSESSESSMPELLDAVREASAEAAAEAAANDVGPEALAATGSKVAAGDEAEAGATAKALPLPGFRAMPVQNRWSRGLEACQRAAGEASAEDGAARQQAAVESEERQELAEQRRDEEERRRRQEEARAEVERLEDLAAEEQARKRLMEAERNRKQKAHKEAEIRRGRENGHAQAQQPAQEAMPQPSQEDRPPVQPPAQEERPSTQTAGQEGPPVQQPAEQERPSVQQPAEQERPTVQQPAEEHRPTVQQPAEEHMPPVQQPAEQEGPAAQQPVQEARPPVQQHAEEEKPPVQQPAEPERPPVQQPAEQERPPVQQPAEQERPPVQTPASPSQRSAAEQKELEEQARKRLMAAERNRKQKAQQDSQARKERERSQVEQAKDESKDSAKAEAAEAERRAAQQAREEEERAKAEAEAKQREEERQRKAKEEAEERERKAREEAALVLAAGHPPLSFDEPSDDTGDSEEEGWAEISVEDVFAEALSITWPGVADMPVESYTVQVRMAGQGAGAPARSGWSRTDLKKPEALLNELPEACDLEVRVAAYLEGVDPKMKPAIGPWTPVRTFELDLSVEKINVDPEGNLRGSCMGSSCRGYISTEAQDPCTETESMPLCARCGVDFSRHCRLSSSGEVLEQPPFAAPAAPSPAPSPPALAPPAPAPALASGTVAEDYPEPANPKRYYIVSSWNDWKAGREMEWNGACQHYECSMEISDEGEESFQILLDKNWDKCVHPNRADACPHIDYKLCGPDGNGHELNWTIGKNTLDDAAVGDRFKIRLFVHEDGRPGLVDWQRLSDAEQRALQAKLVDRPLDISNESPLERKLRWNNLTEDLHRHYRAGETTTVAVPNGRHLPDEAPGSLTQVLAPVREQVTRTVQEKLAKYDSGSQFPRPEDAVHAQREGYELDLLGDALKELRDTIHKSYNYGCAEQVWKIVGGENKGGLKVRVSKDLKSDEKEGLLSTGSLVEQISLVKERLNYRLVSGSGPEEGWISTKIKQKQSAVKILPGELLEVEEEEVEEEKPEEVQRPAIVDEEEMERRQIAFNKEQQLRLAEVRRLRQERDAASKQAAAREAEREKCGSCLKMMRPSLDGNAEDGKFRCNSCWIFYHREAGRSDLASKAKAAFETDEAAADDEEQLRETLDNSFMRASMAVERLEMRCASARCSFCVHSDGAVSEEYCCTGCAEGGPHSSNCQGTMYFAEDEDMLELPPLPPEPAKPSAGPKGKCWKNRPEEPIVIIGLMAAHIATKGRLHRFRHVLRSVKRQEVAAAATEFVFSLSWSSAEEFEDDVESAVSSVSGPNFLSAHQMGRHTQFQHLRAALAKAEDMLSERWASGQRPQGQPSMWVMFGDDDDIWHRRRVDSYAQAMRAHHLLDGVGIFVTTARALCQYGKQLSDADLPVDEESIESFLTSGRGKRMDKQPDTLEWKRMIEAQGTKACTMQLPDELTLEYFDFCPRLRIMREFLNSTSQELLAHRYCDLRFNEFLRLYPFKGGELGLEVAFFFPESWMLFYATPIMEDDHVKKIIEKTDDSAVNINNGHMSANYAVDPADDELGTRALADFNFFDLSVTQSRLARYWAAFRNSVENYIVRHAGEKVDQRLFDLIVYISMQSSFFKFVERLDTMPDAKAIAGVVMMEYIGQGYAKAVARRMDISVLWHRPNVFLEPPSADQEALEQGPAAPPQGKAMMPHALPGYPNHGLGNGGHGHGPLHHGGPGGFKPGGFKPGGLPPALGKGKPHAGLPGPFGKGHPGQQQHSHYPLKPLGGPKLHFPHK